MRVDFFIARRLRLTDNKGNRSRTSIRIATAGVVLSVVVMLMTIAVTSGFKEEIINKLIGFDAELTIEAQAFDVLSPQPPIEDVAKVIEVSQRALPDAVVEQSIKVPAMLKTADDFATVVITPYDGKGNEEFIKANIVEGEFPTEEDEANSILVSTTTANMLQLHVGDKINSCFFASEKMRLRNFEVVAIYNSGFGEYDKMVAYAPLQTLRRVSGLSEDKSQIVTVSGLPVDDITKAQQRLQQELQRAYYDQQLSQYLEVRSVMQAGAVYFNWLSLLDTNVVVVIIIMTTISAFTLIASLIILILERVNMIGTLKMLGATNGTIRRIFIILDLKVLIKGLLLGNIVALGLIILQSATHLLPLDPESYYISFVPVKVSLLQVMALNVGAVAVAILVMLLPSMMITRLKPSKILRWE